MCELCTEREGQYVELGDGGCYDCRLIDRDRARDDRSINSSRGVAVGPAFTAGFNSESEGAAVAQRILELVWPSGTGAAGSEG